MFKLSDLFNRGGSSSDQLIKKALTEMRHSGGSSFLVRLLNNTKFDYASQVGDGTSSSVIMAPVQWLQRSFTEAPLVVMKEGSDGPEKIVDHELLTLIHRPNPFYSEYALWRATILSYLISGNAYWLKIRSAAGTPVELWWAPSSTITPKWPDNGATFISHYEYDAGGAAGKKLIDIDDVVHFRAGIDPTNPRLGLSPLRSVMRESWMDSEASNFVAAILRNGGVPGVIVSPKNDQALAMDVDLVKKYIEESFSGDDRGKPLALGAPTDIKQFGWSPSELDLSVVRNVAEERVCACLGVAAAVVGFGSGLERTKVGATMRELVRSSWTDGVLPLERAFAEELSHSLLPDFSNDKGESCEFDVDDIQALADDLTELYRRADVGVRGGFLTVAAGKRLIGVKPEPGDDVYLRSIATVEVPESGKRPEPVVDEKGLSQEERQRIKDVRGGVYTSPTFGSIDEKAEKKFDFPNHILKKLSDIAARVAVKALLDDELQSAEPVKAEKRAIDLWNKAAVDDALQSAQPIERQVIAQADRAKPREKDLAAIRALDKAEVELALNFEKELIAWFEEIGDEVARAADSVLSAKAIEDEIDLEAILDGTHFDNLRASGLRKYDSHYRGVAEKTFADMNTVFGAVTDLPDPAALRVLETSGRRLGLIDLRGGVKDKLFGLLTDARERGLGVDAIKREIRDVVGAGKFSTPDIRARLIARTETKYAQNVSVVEYSKESGAEKVMVFDARLGPTDAECEALNGVIVSQAEAEGLAAAEHPNGTRSFTPWFE